MASPSNLPRAALRRSLKLLPLSTKKPRILVHAGYTRSLKESWKTYCFKLAKPVPKQSQLTVAMLNLDCLNSAEMKIYRNTSSEAT